MPDSLDNIARDLREAVLGVDHEQAARLAEEYGGAVRVQWEGFSESERALSRLPQQSRELLTWARDVAVMQHAMAGQHLAAMEMAHRYLSARANYLKAATL
jgi:hypothetical protein